jgi:hypothetical protein
MLAGVNTHAGCEVSGVTHWEVYEHDEWRCQLDRQLVRCPRSGTSSWGCTPAQHESLRGRRRICVGAPALLPALWCTAGYAV